jgi:hypothetical protein
MPRICTRRERQNRALDEEDDVPIHELVRKGAYLDALWRAEGRGKMYDIHQIVDWRVKGHGIQFLVWWRDYSIRDSTWEHAACIHPVTQLRFFIESGVMD